MQRGTISHTRPFTVNADAAGTGWDGMDASPMLSHCLPRQAASDWPFSTAPQRALSFVRSFARSRFLPLSHSKLVSAIAMEIGFSLERGRGD